MNAPSRTIAYLCLALSMALVGSYVALSKPLAAAIPVFLLAWMRFGIGGLAMVHWLKKPADELPLTPQVRQLLFLESFLGNFLFTDDDNALADDTSLIQQGIVDSTGILELIGFIEETWHVQVPAQDMTPANFDTYVLPVAP